MTVLTASAKLYEWFTENDSFCLEYDFNKVFPEDQAQDKDRESACVTNALEHFDQMERIGKLEQLNEAIRTIATRMRAFLIKL